MAGNRGSENGKAMTCGRAFLAGPVRTGVEGPTARQKEEIDSAASPSKMGWFRRRER
jgi:hypothetical protein